MPRMPQVGRGPSGPGLKRNSSDSGLRLLVVLVCVSIAMFTFSVREDGSGFFTSLRSGFSVVTAPVSYLGAAITSPFRGLGNIFSNLTADQETLSQLQQENEQLKAENAELGEAQQTASRLEGLLSLQSTYDLQSTAARVISGSTDSWSSTVTIDKGTNSGLAVGMPVTDSNGVIGQIIECGPTSSVVRLLADENSGVSAMVQSSRAQGMLRGSAGGTLRLTLVSTDQEVNVGDNVVTSGLGGVFPKGLPLGTVTSVNKSAGDLYYTIDVEPLASVGSLEEVLVITSLSDDQKATSDDIAAADKQEADQTSSSEPSDSSGSSDSDASDSSSTDSSDSSSSDSSSDSSDSGSDGSADSSDSSSGSSD